MPFYRSLAFLLLLAPLVLAQELRTLAGKTLSGTVQAITDDEVKILTDSGEVKTPLSQVLALDLRKDKGVAPGSVYSDVRLLDDTVLHCSKVSFVAKEVDLTLLSGTSLRLPVTFVVSIFRDAHKEGLRKKWEELTRTPVRRDRIVILRDGELNPLEGTLGEVDVAAQTIPFTREGAPAVALPLSRLQGLVFLRNELPVESPICRVHDNQGSVLSAVKLQSNGEKFTLTTLFGTKVTLEKDSVSRLDFNMGKLTYLSDLEPAKVVEKSAAGLTTPYKRDTNLDGEPIVLDKPYGKGLSLHAHSELEYNLAGKYKEFKAVLGVDPRVGSESQAQVTIWCDGQKRLSETVSTKAVRPVALNVKDVNTLKIVVSSGNFLDLHDHATLAEARVSQ